MRKILILAGPSAVGKTTVAGELIKKEPRFEFIRSATTRAKRADGFDGEYIYLSREEFKAAVSDGKMLEFTEFGDNFYGTPRSEIERIFAEGKIPLLILDINGVRSLKEIKSDFYSFSVYITASLDLLDSRLYERVLTSENRGEAMKIYEKRRAQNRRDLENYEGFSSLFDITVENSVIALTADTILTEFLKK